MWCLMFLFCLDWCVLFVCECLQNFFPAMTKIVGTLGPKSRSVETISACLKAGMSGKSWNFVYWVCIGMCKFWLLIFVVLAVARFDFSWGDSDYHQETLENLKAAIKATKKLCAVCILFFFLLLMMLLMLFCLFHGFYLVLDFFSF